MIFEGLSGNLRGMEEREGLCVPPQTEEVKSASNIKVVALLGVSILAIFLSVLVAVLLWSNHELQQKIDHLKRQIVALELREKELETQVNQLQREKEELLQNAVGLLRQRSSLMKKLISELGLSHYVKKLASLPPRGQGGPYLPPREEYKALLKRMDKYLSMIQKVPIGKPCKGYISSYYGFRRDPFTGKRAFHAGIDIVGRYGEPIRATADGVVYRVGYQRGLGRYVKIKHKHGYLTVYGHLRKYIVKRGERVHKGDIIGYLGNTGRSTGPHLHYEIRYWGRPLNPLKFIRAERKLARLTH